MCTSARDILICMLSDTIHACAILINAAVNGNLDPTLSKGRQAFGVNSTSHLHLQKIEVGGIFTLFIFGRSESAPYLSVGYGESLPNHANFIRQCVNLRLKT